MAGSQSFCLTIDYLFVYYFWSSLQQIRSIKKETIWVKNKVDQFLLKCDEPPLMVSFGGKGSLVAEIRFNKSLCELIYQINQDELPGRIWALRQMANLFPVNQKTVPTISNILSNENFWGLKAEAALLLGGLRTTEAIKQLEIALKSTDYHIRKAVVLSILFASRSADRPGTTRLLWRA